MIRAYTVWDMISIHRQKGYIVIVCELNQTVLINIRSLPRGNVRLLKEEEKTAFLF